MSVTRERNPRGQGDRLREPLLDATIGLISETGDVAKVSVRAITRRAGVSPTALYLHFPDRDAIVGAAIDAGFEAFNGVLREARASEAGPREQLRAMGEAYLAFAAERPALYSVIFTASRPSETARPPAVDRGAGFTGLVEVMTELGADDPPATAVALWSALHGFAMLGACGPPAGEFEPADAFVRRLGNAFVP